MMASLPFNPWATLPSHSDLVPLPSGPSLYLHTQGSPRPPSSIQPFPAVIFEAGSGGLSLLFNPIIRLLCSRLGRDHAENDPGSYAQVRCYAYDRAGIGRSPTPVPPTSRTTANMALELRELLRVTGVDPPWVLVAHSLGGMIVREFLAAAKKDEVVGLVLVDAASERWAPTYKFPLVAMGRVLQGAKPVDHGAVMERLTMEERQIYDVVKERRDVLTPEEMACMLRSSEELAEKRQFETQPMGDWPVVVIRGNGYRSMKAMLDAADPNAGTVEDRADLEGLLARIGEHDEEFQRQQLKLGSNSRFRRAANSGHNVHASDPDVVAEEIQAVLQEVASRFNVRRIQNSPVD